MASYNTNEFRSGLKILLDGDPYNIVANEFVKPGKGTLHAEFRLDAHVLDEIRAETANGQKYLRWMPADVFNAQNEVVARVRKQIYVRLKPEARTATG